MTSHLVYDRLDTWYTLPSAQASKLLHRLHESCKEQISTMTNAQLFDDYSSLLMDDDREGYLSYGGQVAMDALTEELESRLKAIGFLADG